MPLHFKSCATKSAKLFGKATLILVEYSLALHLQKGRAEDCSRRVGLNVDHIDHTLRV